MDGKTTEPNGQANPREAKGTPSVFQADRSTGICGVPVGWEITRIGIPNKGEHFLDYNDIDLMSVKAEVEYEGCHAVAIVARVGEWTPLRRLKVLSVPFQARYRNHLDEPWTYGNIIAHKPGVMQWRADNGFWYRYAQTFNKENE